MKVNTDSGMKPNSFRPIPEQRSASPESPGNEAGDVAARFFFVRIFATSDPTNAPAKPAICETTGVRLTLSAAKDTAQNPSKPAPATFVILEIFIPEQC